MKFRFILNLGLKRVMIFEFRFLQVFINIVHIINDLAYIVLVNIGQINMCLGLF